MTTYQPLAAQEISTADSWFIREEGWHPELQHAQETLFTIGNGHLCARGILEEMTAGTIPGTFVAGIYDRTGAQITELVNLPNPFVFRLDVYGEKLDPSAMDILGHTRTLDMRHGVLCRKTLYQTTHNKRIDYRSCRLISLADKHVAAMEIAVAPLDADMTFTVQTSVGIGVSNQGATTEGRKRHFQPFEILRKNGVVYLSVETLEKQELVAYATAFEILHHGRTRLVSDRAVQLRMKKGEWVVFRKYIAVVTSRSLPRNRVKRKALASLKAARLPGFDLLLENHRDAWTARWDVADIEVDGAPDVTRALRFNMYHLIIAGSEEDDDVSIGARTLSGEGYRGHVFWDTELFILPFFIYTNPRVARNLLLYRYHRLDAARHNATANDHSGALFPWESADTGEECTPSWSRDYDGTIIQIVTMEQEHHIVADIAYAFMHYCQATGDTQFFWNRALEVLVETARFWRGRVELNPSTKRYEILHVMGPDEFHEDVNNNAYTNMMARWNLRTAAERCLRAKRDRPRRFSRLARRLKVTAAEIRAWRQIADQLVVSVDKRRRLIKPFDGYFGLKDHRITKRDEHGMPVLPRSLSWRTVGKTQLIKQADVVMLLFLLGDDLSIAEKRRNYRRNEARTLHKSSLSPAIHAIVGLEVGDQEQCLAYFSRTLVTDLDNIHGNTDLGFHAASGGGTWQAAIMGFAGMRPRGRHLVFNPHLPKRWKGIRFSMWWRGCLLRVVIRRKGAEIHCDRRSSLGDISVEMYGITKRLIPRKTVKFSPAGKGRKRRSAAGGS